MNEITRRPDEVGGLSDLAFRELAGAVGGIGAIHRAIATRAFSGTGPGGRPAQLVHDAISDRVYGLLRGGTSLLGQGSVALLGRRLPTTERELSTTARGSAVLGVINGLIGDALEEEGSDLQEPMSVRMDGQVVPLEPAALAQAFPQATPRLAVFVHGLMETEFAWRLGAARAGGTYASRLSRDLGCTPIELRYNTGRHISENGRSLAGLLEELVEAWPVEVDRIELIGHSMGGLVSRSACHYAAAEQARWAGLVRHVVSLGTPHMGAPLEQAVHWRAPASMRSRRCVRSARSCAGAAPGSATCARARSWTRTGATATRTRCAPPHSPRCRCSTGDALLRGRHDHAQPAPPVGRVIGDCLVLSRARRAAAATGGSHSRPSTACTSAARTTSRCSTTRRSTSGCATGSRPAGRPRRLSRRSGFPGRVVAAANAAGRGSCRPRRARRR